MLPVGNLAMDDVELDRRSALDARPRHVAPPSRLFSVAARVHAPVRLTLGVNRQALRSEAGVAQRHLIARPDPALSDW
jgi:hypothetical protein